MLKKNITRFFILLLIPVFSIAQSGVNGIELDENEYSSLWDKFEYFEVFQIDAAKVNDIVTSETENHELRLTLGQYDWKLAIYPNDIRASSYKRMEGDASETREVTKLPCITYSGQIVGNAASRVDITITDNLLLGIVNDGHNEYFIEKVRNILEEVPHDIYVVYNLNSVIPNPNLSCGMDEVHKTHEHEIKKIPTERPDGMACYEALVGLATDAGMATKHGGGTGAQSHVTGILNLVQANFDNEFLDEIKFVIGASFNAVGTNPATWNFGTIGSLLTTFGQWANSGGFGTTAYDVATLWTSKSFGGVIGLAWLNAVCGGNRYNVCVDYTSGSNGLRNLQAHELGHNFSLTHDASGSPHIMAPAVNGSNTWSAQSKSQMNGAIPFSCMGACIGGVPPIPDFVAAPPFGCKPMVVNFTDLSLNAPTQWFWTFEGGNPATSTQQNPTVSYSVPGTYDVTLEVSNSAGTNTEFRANHIDVGDVPIPDFDAVVALDEVICIDKSIVYGQVDYLWDFGDGNFSTERNPTHVYEKDGLYRIILTINSLCGNGTFQDIVSIVTPPTADFSAEEREICIGSMVEFKNESTENVTTYKWLFEGGLPNSSADENPTVTYDTAGVYKVELTVSNTKYIDVEKKTGYVIVDTHSVARFVTDINPDSLRVKFTNESPNARSYAWNFGDGGSSTLANPKHIYGEDSVYNVVLITENFCGSDTTTETITVGRVPTAGFMAEDTLGCLPHTVDFEDASSENTKYRLWKFEGGTPASSTEKNPSVSYSDVGQYKVTLLASNGLGTDTLVEEKYITIEDDPVAEFDFVRNGYEITFNNTHSGGTSFIWDFGDNENSNEENPVHTYSGDGTYNVVLIVSNHCGSDTMEQELEISNRPHANFQADVNVGCVPLTVKLENQSSSNTDDVEWIIPGGNPGRTTEDNPTVVFNNPGFYRVTLIANNAFGEDTVEKQDFIEVLDVPVANYSVNLTGFTIEFTNTSEYGKRFAWNFGDGETSDLEDPTHVFTDEGIYTVVLIVENLCGADTISKEITVTPKPIVDFISDMDEICYDEMIQFTDKSANNPTSWNWTFEGGNPSTSTEQNPLVTYASPGVYRVTLEAINQFGSNELVLDSLITVYGDPVSLYDYVEQGVRINFKNESEQFGSFLWEFGDGDMSNEFEPSHLYRVPGTYEVTLSVTNECGLDTYVRDIMVRHRDISFITVAPPPVPNPSGGRVAVNFNGKPAHKITVLISGINGRYQELLTQDFTSGELSAELDLGHLEEGTYMIFFKTEHEVTMSKVVIQK